MFKKVFILFFLSLIIVGCGQEEEIEKKKQRIINISTSPVQIYNFKDQESAIGTIEGLMDPTIRSEIASSVKKIYTKTGTILKKGELIAQLDNQDYRYQLELAEAELSQLKIRLHGQNKTYQRNSELVDENFISPNALDEIVNQKNETEELIKISEAKAKIAKYRLSKTKIYSPISGKVEKQIASIGDFLKIGDPIIQIMNNDRLRAHVPFPEKLATKLKPGLPIELKSPIVEEKIIVKIAELKPQLISDSLSIDVIADISCDIDGPIASTIRPSSIDDPIYGFNKTNFKECDFHESNAIAVMAVDNLPCELPRNSSEMFGEMFLAHVIPSFFNNDNRDILKNSMITSNRQLTARFKYLSDYIL